MSPTPKVDPGLVATLVTGCGWHEARDRYVGGARCKYGSYYGEGGVAATAALQGGTIFLGGIRCLGA